MYLVLTRRFKGMETHHHVKCHCAPPSPGILENVCKHTGHNGNGSTGEDAR